MLFQYMKLGGGFCMAEWVKEREEKRSEMIYYGMNYGFNHHKTVKLSQELDEILNKEKIESRRGCNCIQSRK